MTSTLLIRLQDAALDVANLALVENVPASQWQAAVERYSIAKIGYQVAQQTVERAARGLDANGGIVNAAKYDRYLSNLAKTEGK